MKDNNIVEILLVEDNMDDANLAIRTLKKHHLSNHLLHLRDGEEALNYLFGDVNRQLPKIILLDIKMPKVDGIEVLRRVRQDERLKYIPIVVMTSSREESDIIASYKLGVNAYIVKPVDFAKFAEAVKETGYFWLMLNEAPQ